MTKETEMTEAMPTLEELHDTPVLDACWVRGNGEVVEVQDMNEWHAKNALRILINAIARNDRDTINEHLLGKDD